MSKKIITISFLTMIGAILPFINNGIIAQSLKPDFVIESIVPKGDNFEVKICNNGTNDSDVYPNVKAEANNLVEEFPEFTSTLTPLAQGDCKSWWFNYDTFQMEKGKIYEVKIMVDPANTIAELDETNNVLTKTIQAGPKPRNLDLIIKTVNFIPAVPSVQEDTLIKVTIVNNGPEQINADESIDASIYYYKKEPFGFSGPYLTQSVSGGLLMEEGREIIFGPIQFTIAGEYEFRIKVDPENNFPEINDDNNLKKTSLTVTSPIILLYPNGGEVLVKNKQYTIRWESENSDEKINIRYWQIGPGGIQKSIARYVANTGSYNWVVPSDMDTTRQYKIEVSLSESGIKAYSDRAFNVVEEETDTTPPSPPKDIKVSFSGDQTSVIFTWTNPIDDDFSHIRIYKSDIEGFIGKIFKNNLHGKKGASTGLAVKITVEDLKPGNTYYFTLRSVDTPGNESVNRDQYKVTLVPAEVSPVESIIEASPGYVLADGKSIANIIVTVRDKERSNLSNRLVKLASSRGSVDNIRHITNFTGQDGRIVFSVTSSLPGTSIFSAVADGVSLNQTAKVVFVDPKKTCLPDNTLVKLPNDPKVYVIKNCQRHWIKTIDEFREKGYRWEQIKEVPPEVIQAHAEELKRLAKLLRAKGRNEVYRIVQGRKLWIPSPQAFQKLGHSPEEIEEVDEAEVEDLPRAKLLKPKNDPRVFYITGSGLKRHIPNPDVFLSYGNRWEDVVEVDPELVDIYPDDVLIKGINDPRVYKLENGKKRWIKSPQAFKALGLRWNQIAPVNDVELNAYPDGEPIALPVPRQTPPTGRPTATRSMALR